MNIVFMMLRDSQFRDLEKKIFEKKILTTTMILFLWKTLVKEYKSLLRFGQNFFIFFKS